MRDATNREHALQRRVSARLRVRCGVARGDRLLVAVSGGADSVALVLLLADLAPALELTLVVAHFDHALRPESTAEATWVAEFARARALEYHSERWQTPRPGEAAARQARYDFLTRAARASNCTAIVTAHHLDDQIETAILRLGRGTGLRGIGAMAWRRRGPVPIVRPLLDTRRAHLRELCIARGAEWLEDPSNASRDRARNRVRLDVLPALESALGPRWMEHWGRALDDVRSVSQRLESEAAALLRDACDGGITATRTASSCDLQRLHAAPDTVLRAALLQWLDPAHPNRAHIDAAVRLVRRGRSGRAILLPLGFRLAREQAGLTLLAPSAAAPAAGPEGSLEVQPLAVADAQRALAAAASRGAAPALAPPEAATAHLAADALQPPFELRAPRPGDRIQLLGAPGRRTLARLFQDRRIPRRARASWPVVADRDGIVWLPGVGIAERGRIVPGTSAALRASYRHGHASGGTTRGLPEDAPGP
jgi:tRNA(Ile)-lysidine synthase